MIPCGSELSPPLFRRPVTTVVNALYGSSGFKICGKSNVVPTASGFHRAITAPCGKYTKPSRGAGAAAVAANAVAAGIIASSSGKPIAMPAPRSTARREMCLRVMNISSSPRSSIGTRRFRVDRRCGAPHLKCRTGHDAHHQSLEPIVVGRGRAHDRAHARHVLVIERTTERVRHELLGQVLHELIRLAQQRVAQIVRAIEQRAVRQLAVRVDRAAREAIALAVLADGVEVLQREAERIEQSVATV